MWDLIWVLVQSLGAPLLSVLPAGRPDRAVKRWPRFLGLSTHMGNPEKVLGFRLWISSCHCDHLDNEPVEGESFWPSLSQDFSFWIKVKKPGEGENKWEENQKGKQAKSLTVNLRCCNRMRASEGRSLGQLLFFVLACSLSRLTNKRRFKVSKHWME